MSEARLQLFRPILRRLEGYLEIKNPQDYCNTRAVSLDEGKHAFTQKERESERESERERERERGEN